MVRLIDMGEHAWEMRDHGAWAALRKRGLTVEEERIVRVGVVHEPMHGVHDVLLRRDETRVSGVVRE